MNAKHTPGPWHIDGRDVCAWDGKIETTICECYAHISIGRYNAEDNARLIAAAPDLLSAIELIANAFANGEHVIEYMQGVARAALAKLTR